jgi:hypothetical protein
MKEARYFYHLVTNKKMEHGQVIDFSSTTTNTLYKFFFEKEFRNRQNEDVNRKVSSNITDDGLCLNMEDSRVIKAYLNNVSRSIRETVVEMVRLQKFPDYPSRLSCLYAARTYEEVLKWKELFESYNRKVLQIVKLVTDGNYFIGDGDLLPTNEASSFDIKIAQARSYWNGLKEDVLPEVLLSGKIKVVEIVKQNE